MSASRLKRAAIPWRELPTLGVAEAAEVIGVSVRHVRRMLDSGELRDRKAGGRRLVLTSSLIEWEKGEDEAKVATIQPDAATIRAAQRWVAGGR